MKVILTERVKSLGSVGEVVNVSQGYARNYLIPNSLAMLADEGNTKQINDYQKMLAKKVEEEKKAAEEVAGKLKSTTITLVKKVGGNGRLFGTVTNAELSRELAKAGLEVERRLIHIEDPIKTTGEYEITTKLFKGVEATFKVNVEMDPKQAAEMKKKQEAAAKKKASKKTEAKADEATEEATETEETQA
jgi:large subunit ribosomal protein L9